MSTITSPRVSSPVRSVASSRTSLDAPAGRPNQPSRRNRADRSALRDYYGLKSAENADATSTDSPRSPGLPSEEVERSELDDEGFNVQGYVKNVLATKDLENVLRIEAGLMSEIRGLDGERKALVYDNYSKLIAATETIRKMRTNMDPLTPTTSTLSPAISHIAETATALSASLVGRHAQAVLKEQADKSLKDTQAKQTVRWVLDAPRRLKALVEDGNTEEAEKDWEEVRRLLEIWKGVDGVEKVRKQCEDALKVPET